MSYSKPIISIIIPCYNAGKYLPDALESIKTYEFKGNYEVIIVNDGSTDKLTLSFLHTLKNEAYTIIHQDNKGPAAARNTGIRYAKGEYILFLDSDNKIRSAYIDKGIEVLKKCDKVGIVYSNACFFGDTSENRFQPGAFNMGKLLAGNYIDMCSIIRRSVWEQLGGLDEARIIIGHEDWDFWIRAGAAGWGFCYLDEVLFDYRIVNNSLIKQTTQSEKYVKMLNYVFSKHYALYTRHLNSKDKKVLLGFIYNTAVHNFKNRNFISGWKYILYTYYYSNFDSNYLKNGIYWSKAGYKGSV